MTPAIKERETTSVIARIASRAVAHGDDLACVFLSREAEPIELTWSALDTRLRLLARTLIAKGVEPGHVTFVLSASPYEQVLGFLAVLAAGGIPSILSFPSVKQSRERFFETLRPIAASTSARWILSSNDLAETANHAALSWGVVTFPPHDALLRETSQQPLPAAGSSFLQFSSGTTGLRKCVRITEAMLADQAASYAAALALTPDDRIASWLPLYHDMGLIAAFLMPAYAGNVAVHLSPFDWLKEPSFFLRAIARYRATLAWMPNFAYPLTAAQVTDDELAALDLSSLRALVNCSEPVRAAAHDAFLARFRAAGVRAEHLQACYAMAEATFAVTQTAAGRASHVDRIDGDAFASTHCAVPIEGDRASRRAITFVSSGAPIRGVDIRIDGAAEERRVGEVLLRGPSLFAGYGIDASRRDAFTEDGWYRTGDLGYVANGELYVTGRAKDVVIHRGSNIYPADVEEAFATIRGLRPGRAVVFGVYDESEGTEQLVAMVEAEDGIDSIDLLRQIREAVWAELSISLADVRICSAGTLLKSTSGKLSRSANRDLYRKETIAPAKEARQRPALHDAYVAPRDLWERQLVILWEEILDVRPIGIDDNVFLDLSADSLSTTRVASEIRRRHGRDITPTTLLGADSVRRQAAILRSGDSRAETILTLQRKGKATPLFLVHAAGGWAFPYVALARYLGTDRPIHAFQAPQLHHGDVTTLSVTAIASAYIDALRKIQPRGPYHIAGWSFGGLVAFEMANQLRASGETIGKLVLFDTTPPAPASARIKMRALHTLLSFAFRASLRAPWLQRIGALRGVGEMAPLWRFFAACHMGADRNGIGPLLRYAFGERCDRARIDGASEDALWDYLVELANERPTREEQLLLIPGIDGAGARRALAVSMTLERLNATYATSSVYDGPIDIFGVRGNERLSGWQKYASRPLRIHWFDVARLFVDPHFDMMEDDNVKIFAPALRRLLDETSDTKTELKTGIATDMNTGASAHREVRA